MSFGEIRFFCKRFGIATYSWQLSSVISPGAPLMPRPTRTRRPSFETLEARQLMTVGIDFGLGDVLYVSGDDADDNLYVSVDDSATRIRLSPGTGPTRFIELGQARRIEIDLG